MSSDQATPCPNCKSTNVEIGRIRGTGRLVPEEEENLFFSLGRKVITTACLDCGLIWLRLKDVPSK